MYCGILDEIWNRKRALGKSQEHLNKLWTLLEKFVNVGSLTVTNVP